jgi:hypothetical protein
VRYSSAKHEKAGRSGRKEKIESKQKNIEGSRKEERRRKGRRKE